MNIDMHLMIEARNYAYKSEQELKDANAKWIKRLNSLEEQYEAERNELTKSYNLLRSQFELYQKINNV